MTNPMIEAAARAMADLVRRNGIVPKYSDYAQAAITAIEPMIRADERAQVEREIVEWLRGPDCDSDSGSALGYAAAIEAGEYRRHNPNCAVVRNGNLRAWCDCGKGDG
ncbi:MAG: hypothetical protein ABFE07_20580 [Armatimonadia bacterium]